MALCPKVVGRFKSAKKYRDDTYWILWLILLLTV